MRKLHTIGTSAGTPPAALDRQGRLTRREVLQGGLCSALFFMVGLGANGCASSSPNQDSNTPASGEFALSGRPLVQLPADNRVPIIWIEAGVCTGCAESLLASVDPGVEDVLPLLRLEFQETLMDGSGVTTTDKLLATAEALKGQFLLVVDGAVSYDAFAAMTVLGATSSGQEWTAQDLIAKLATQALAVIALGTCAAFGGIPSAAPNPTGSASISRLVPSGKPFVRLPGCPPNPGWIVDTLQVVLGQGLAALNIDSLGRPKSAYGGLIHDVCPRRGRYESGDFATAPGDPERCLITVGCKGPDTHADCPKRLWNGRSSCINANHPCIGCAAPGFPDAHSEFGDEGQVAASPFYYDP